MPATASRTLQTGHVGINVSDLNRSIDFYTQVFGFEVSARGTEPDRRFAFLTSEGSRANHPVGVVSARIPRG
jgi:lactoylglutathione lyase